MHRAKAFYWISLEPLWGIMTHHLPHRYLYKRNHVVIIATTKSVALVITTNGTFTLLFPTCPSDKKKDRHTFNEHTHTQPHHHHHHPCHHDIYLLTICNMGNVVVHHHIAEQIRSSDAAR